MILLHVQHRTAPGPRSDCVIELPAYMIMSVWVTQASSGESAGEHVAESIVELPSDLIRRSSLGPGISVECQTIEDALDYLRKELKGSAVM